jgi:hypothetical protein
MDEDTGKPKLFYVIDVRIILSHTWCSLLQYVGNTMQHQFVARGRNGT